MTDFIDISGLSKAEVLAALYNRARAQGMGFMQYDATPMSTAEAADIIQKVQRNGPEDPVYFDYLKGRVMKLSLDGDQLDARLYDRDNGKDAALGVINALRKTGMTNPEEVERLHKENTRSSAEFLQSKLDEETTVKTGSGFAEVSMGLKDVAPHLKPRLDRVLNDRPDHEGDE